MLSKEVRQGFLDFFKEKGHQIVPSSPVIPAQDPTLLFINAGMNQFKDVFLGLNQREYTRVADTQKCIRVSGKHNDLEEVGVDTSHHTFFEMLGNWSFGDYYKAEAIKWAWELITEVWKLDKNRLYATVYLDDDESENLWYNETGILPGRVSRLGKEENFWEMGDTGPCGPCSELHYDIRDDISEKKSFDILDKEGSIVELWNLVFIQYNRLPDQSLEELPAKHVDTGMGFERITAVIQGKKSNYDTDLFRPIFDVIQDVTGKEYITDSKGGVAFRVLGDHIRALSFAIADGALPSNDGRGYVLRRILRRAARYGRELEMKDPFIYKLVSPVVEILGPVFPELVERSEFISNVIKSEEESFGQTLDRGIDIFNKVAGNTKSSGSDLIPGGDAFKLYDTFGFPLDLTELMAREIGLKVDQIGFDKKMKAQKERSHSKKSMAMAGDMKGTDITTDFNYQDESQTVVVSAIYDKDGARIQNAEGGQKVDIQLGGSTPFYAESGGQIGDSGTLTSDSGTVVEIYDTQKSTDSTIFHLGKIVKGILNTGDNVVGSVNSERRRDIKRNHTATHLLHKALRDVLGAHVQQAGSLVTPDYLRLDFNHFKKMTVEQIAEVENIVNGSIRKNFPVAVLENVPINKAKGMGAMALFGEKYGEKVRVISIGEEYSNELCGGTHVDSTGDIGEFRIVSESAIAARVRRIVAETGVKASERTAKERLQLSTLRNLLNAGEDDLIEKTKLLVQEKKSLDKSLKKIRQESSKNELYDIIDTALSKEGAPVISHRFSVSSADELKEIGDIIRGKMPEGVALLGTVINDKALLVCVVGDDLLNSRKIKAGDLVKSVAGRFGGGGGGRPHMATAGIKDSSKLDEALQTFYEVFNSAI